MAFIDRRLFFWVHSYWVKGGLNQLQDLVPTILGLAHDDSQSPAQIVHFSIVKLLYLLVAEWFVYDLVVVPVNLFEVLGFIENKIFKALQLVSVEPIEEEVRRQN